MLRVREHSAAVVAAPDQVLAVSSDLVAVDRAEKAAEKVEVDRQLKVTSQLRRTLHLLTLRLLMLHLLMLHLLMLHLLILHLQMRHPQKPRQVNRHLRHRLHARAWPYVNLNRTGNTARPVFLLRLDASIPTTVEYQSPSTRPKHPCASC